MPRFALLAAALLLAACATTTAPAPETAPTAPAPAATAAADDGCHAEETLGALHWTRTSAEMRADYVQTYRDAGAALEELAAGREPGTWAVALDADETVIDNSLYQKERAAEGLCYTSESWAEWVQRREAPPLPGAVAFLERVRELGGTIAIVTNRRQPLCADTEANFEAYDIPYDVILCRREDARKEARWRSIEEGSSPLGPPGREILLWLGDNITDFPGQDQDLRLAPPEALDAFGRRWFVLPNPMYGSWEDNPPN